MGNRHRNVEFNSQGRHAEMHGQCGESKGKSALNMW